MVAERKVVVDWAYVAGKRQEISAPAIRIQKYSTTSRSWRRQCDTRQNAVGLHVNWNEFVLLADIANIELRPPVHPLQPAAVADPAIDIRFPRSQNRGESHRIVPVRR